METDAAARQATVLSYRLGARAAATIRRASEIRDNRIKAPTLSDFSLIGVWSGRTTGLHSVQRIFWFPGFADFEFMLFDFRCEDVSCADVLTRD